MLSANIITSLLPLLSAAATTHTVKVGNGALKMDPDNVKAEVGDMIQFEFYPMNHSIAQASFEKPCEPMSASGDMKPIFSGFMPADGKEFSKIFTIMVNNTDPVWLYCSQASHCKSGQVMVINQKDGSDQTLDKFKEAAKKMDMSSSPSEVYGGVIADYEEPKSTKGNPSTPATATYHSSSTSATKSTASASHTNAAVKSGPAAAAFAVSMIAGIFIGSACGLLT